MTTIVRKTVAFNTDDPQQLALLQYVESKTSNFSAYGKGLILLDMMRANGEIAIGVAPTMSNQPVMEMDEQPDVEKRSDDFTDEDRKLMGDLLG